MRTTKNRFDLEGETILLTGASRGIGAAMAQLFLNSGARVIGTFAAGPGAMDALAKGYPDQLAILKCDFVHPEWQSPHHLFAEAEALMGPVTALVNNAGTMPSTPLDVTDAQWDGAWAGVMGVNLKAVADLSRAAVRAWQGRASGGRIVSVASRAAFRGDTLDALHYAASKGGVVALMRSLARAIARDRILAFTLAPGWTDTDMAAVARDPANAHMLDEIPMGAAAPPEEVARMAAFLLAGLADHATGATFDINGASYVR